VAVAIVLATIVAYAPALRAPFQFDDFGSIVGNPTIRQLSRSTVLHPPTNTSVAGRPVVNVTLAINYAINAWLGVEQRPFPFGVSETVGYHIVNLLAHLLCALLLFGIVRRTLRSEKFSDVWRRRADDIALVVAAVWLLHPLQSETINYVIQRTESLVSLCYLGTLYGAVRAWDTPNARARLLWRAFAVVACLIGVWTKEVIVTAPLIVLLYDRAFRVGSWREVFADTRRVVLYGVLAALSILVILLSTTNARFNTVGFGLGITWYEYLYSQAWAITRYLQLFLWPDRLTFDYGQHPVTGLAAVPGCIILGVFGIATILAWMRAERWGWFGFLGAWFFLILAPSSSVVPIVTEIAAERRVYLAIAAVIVLTVAAIAHARDMIVAKDAKSSKWAIRAALLVGLVYALASGWTATSIASGQVIVALLVRAVVGALAAAAFWLLVRSARIQHAVVAIALVLTAATMARSLTYANAETLWRDTLRKSPNNPRALDNLAFNLFYADPPRLTEAKQLYQQSLAIDSTYLLTWPGLASIAVKEGNLSEAVSLLQRGLAINPSYAAAVEQLGQVLAKEGRFAQAIPYLGRFAATFPSDSAFEQLGIAYMSVGHLDSAATAFRSALDLNPDRVDAALYLGGMLTEQGRGADAIPLLEGVAARGAATGTSLGLLSLAYAESGRADDARQAVRAALASGDEPSVDLLVGRTMGALGQSQDALKLFARAVELQPSNAEALTRLGMAHASLGHRSEAADAFKRALDVDPSFTAAREALDALGR
jgi:tetratricopeptide (TPR) repeat protein